MNERLKTHSKTQKKSADLVSNKLRIGVFQQYQMKCKSVSKKSPRYTELQGVYIEEHDGRKQVWCYVIKPRDAQSTLLKGEKL
ncbi:hypothetical protein OFI97_RS16815 [Escherichia coli]|nr:hypothetical protein [Escherichia coli]